MPHPNPKARSVPAPTHKPNFDFCLTSQLDPIGGDREGPVLLLVLCLLFFPYLYCEGRTVRVHKAVKRNTYDGFNDLKLKEIYAELLLERVLRRYLWGTLPGTEIRGMSDDTLWEFYPTTLRLLLSFST